jgi:Trk K+ transport system NAD-binding subunit
MARRIPSLFDSQFIQCRMADDRANHFHVSATDAKRYLGTAMKDLTTNPQDAVVIERRGKPIAVIMSPEEYMKATGRSLETSDKGSTDE